MITALILTAALAAQPSNMGTTPEGDVGWVTADGTIVTEQVYNELYADPYAGFDAIAYVFGITVEREPVDVVTPAAERPREFQGETLPSVAELIEQAEEAFDNPAFA